MDMFGPFGYQTWPVTECLLYIFALVWATSFMNDFLNILSNLDFHRKLNEQGVIFKALSFKFIFQRFGPKYSIKRKTWNLTDFGD